MSQPEGPDADLLDYLRDCSWPTLAAQSGTRLTDHYVDILRAAYADGKPLPTPAGQEDGGSP